MCSVGCSSAKPCCYCGSTMHAGVPMEGQKGPKGQAKASVSARQVKGETGRQNRHTHPPTHGQTDGQADTRRPTVTGRLGAVGEPGAIGSPGVLGKVMDVHGRGVRIVNTEILCIAEAEKLLPRGNWGFGLRDWRDGARLLVVASHASPHQLQQLHPCHGIMKRSCAHPCCTRQHIAGPWVLGKARRPARPARLLCLLRALSTRLHADPRPHTRLVEIAIANQTICKPSPFPPSPSSISLGPKEATSTPLHPRAFETLKS